MYWLISFCFRKAFKLRLKSTQLKEFVLLSLLWKDGTDQKMCIKQKFKHLGFFVFCIYIYRYSVVNEHPRFCRKLTWLCYFVLSVLTWYTYKNKWIQPPTNWDFLIFLYFAWSILRKHYTNANECNHYSYHVGDTEPQQFGLEDLSSASFSVVAAATPFIFMAPVLVVVRW